MFEEDVLSAIIRAGTLKEALDCGIRSDDFGTARGRAVFDQLLAWYTAIASPGLPGPEAFAKLFPEFALSGDRDVALPWLCSQLRLDRLRREAKAAAEHLAASCDANPPPALAAALAELQRLTNLASTGHADVMFGPAVTDAVQRYHLIKSGAVTAVSEWPWAPMNEATGGLQVGDYIIFYGRPKTMKSWVAATMAAFAVDHGRRVLLYTKEMTSEQMLLRVAACIAHLPYQELRRGRLSHEDEQSLSLLQKMLSGSEMGDHLVCLDGSGLESGQDTVGWLRAKAEKYGSEIVIVDGLYLMSDEACRKEPADHIRVRNISRALRAMALQRKIPVIATMQANRRAAGHGEGRLEEIAYSDAIAQDATLAMRTVPDKSAPYLNLVVAGSREFKLEGIRIHAVPAVDFSFDSVLNEVDLAEVKDIEDKPVTGKSIRNASADPFGLSPQLNRLLQRQFKAAGLPTT